MKRGIIAKSITLAVLIVFAGITANAQQTAQVKNVNKHRGFVYIDKGEDVGFEVGSFVCIYSSSDEVIACGKVSSTSGSRHAMIRIDREKSHYIRNGMKAKLVVEKKDKSESKEKDNQGG